MDSKKDEDVLLENVAQTENQNKESPETRRMAGQRDKPRNEPKRLLALIAIAGDTNWNDHGVACKTRSDISQRAMGFDTLSTMNRVVRSRMLRGVGIGRRYFITTFRLPDLGYDFLIDLRQLLRSLIL